MTAGGSLIEPAPRPGVAARLSRAWILYLLLGGLVVLVENRLSSSDSVHAVMMMCLDLVGVLAVAAGVHLYRPAGPAVWALVGAGQLLVLVGDVLWWLPAFSGGQPPPPPSAADVFFLASYPLTAAALLLVIRRREGRAGLLDSTTVAVGLSLAVGVFLITPYASDGSLPAALRATQIGYAALDVVLFAAAVRLLLVPGRLEASRLLLAAGSFSFLFSDFAANWTTLIGTYVAGKWLDLGWVLAPLLVGAAALHPSMRSLSKDGSRRGVSLRWWAAIFLAAASLTGFAVLGVEFAVDGALDLLDVSLIVGGGAALAVLVLARMAGLIRDARRLSRELAQQNDELRELDRLKDELIALVSHELRTPLTSIRGYLQLLDEDEALGELTAEERRSFFAVMDRNSERLLRLVEELLLVAGLRAGNVGLERSELELEPLLRESIEAVAPGAAAKGIELELVPGPLPRLAGDRAQLAQVIDNLLSNALKFTPEGGRITVRSSATPEAVVLEVEDSGIGIPAGEHEHISEKFFRSSNATELQIQGTGLGLHIAKWVVEAHGGTIGFDSEEGVGTTFRISLPLEPDSGAPDDPGRRPELEAA